jgi:hypothetical protein
MRKFIVAILLTVFAPLAFAGAHLNGSWSLTVDLGGQGGVATFNLTETGGGKLTGTYSGQLGMADVVGTTKGADVQFSFDVQGMAISYIGKYADGKLSGKCTYGDLGQGTFAGGKAEGASHD